MAAVAETPPAAPVAAPPTSVPEIKVSSLTPPPGTPAAPKPGSARERMTKELRQRFSGETPAAPAKPAAEAPTSPAPTTPPAAEPSPSPAEAPAGTTPATEADKKGKNPWKIVDEYKQRVTKLETDLVEAGKRSIPEAEWKSKQETLAKMEARNKELEDEIRYVNYQKSDEFKQKHQVPYEAAWKRAMSELGELTVEDNGQVRQFKPQDILELVNLPLQKAREQAVALYGEFADDVMQHRKEIRRLYDEQSAALDEVRKSGGEREKQRMEQATAAQQTLVKDVTETWKSANEGAVKDAKYGKYFMPVEGDQEGNQKLAKGFELADRAFTENPFDSKLTPEQRRAIVERHAAVRNRCAAFGRLTYQVEQKAARIAELEKELAEYKGAEPPAGGSQTPAKPTGTSAKESIFGSLRKLAK